MRTIKVWKKVITGAIMVFLAYGPVPLAGQGAADELTLHSHHDDILTSFSFKWPVTPSAGSARQATLDPSSRAPASFSVLSDGSSAMQSSILKKLLADDDVRRVQTLSLVHDGNGTSCDGPSPTNNTVSGCLVIAAVSPYFAEVLRRLYSTMVMNGYHEQSSPAGGLRRRRETDSDLQHQISGVPPDYSDPQISIRFQVKVNTSVVSMVTTEAKVQNLTAEETKELLQLPVIFSLEEVSLSSGLDLKMTSYVSQNLVEDEHSATTDLSIMATVPALPSLQPTTTDNGVLSTQAEQSSLQTSHLSARAEVQQTVTSMSPFLESSANVKSLYKSLAGEVTPVLTIKESTLEDVSRPEDSLYPSSSDSWDSGTLMPSEDFVHEQRIRFLDGFSSAVETLNSFTKPQISAAEAGPGHVSRPTPSTLETSTRALAALPVKGDNLPEESTTSASFASAFPPVTLGSSIRGSHSVSDSAASAGQAVSQTQLSPDERSLLTFAIRPSSSSELSSLQHGTSPVNPATMQASSTPGSHLQPQYSLNTSQSLSLSSLSSLSSSALPSLPSPPPPLSPPAPSPLQPPPSQTSSVLQDSAVAESPDVAVDATMSAHFVAATQLLSSFLLSLILPLTASTHSPTQTLAGTSGTHRSPDVNMSMPATHTSSPSTASLYIWKSPSFPLPSIFDDSASLASSVRGSQTFSSQKEPQQIAETLKGSASQTPEDIADDKLQSVSIFFSAPVLLTPGTKQMGTFDSETSSSSHSTHSSKESSLPLSAHPATKILGSDFALHSTSASHGSEDLLSEVGEVTSGVMSSSTGRDDRFLSAVRATRFEKSQLDHTPSLSVNKKGLVVESSMSEIIELTSEFSVKDTCSLSCSITKTVTLDQYPSSSGILAMTQSLHPSISLSPTITLDQSDSASLTAIYTLNPYSSMSDGHEIELNEPVSGSNRSSTNLEQDSSNCFSLASTFSQHHSVPTIGISSYISPTRTLDYGTSDSFNPTSTFSQVPARSVSSSNTLGAYPPSSVITPKPLDPSAGSPTTPAVTSDQPLSSSVYHRLTADLRPSISDSSTANSDHFLSSSLVSIGTLEQLLSQDLYISSLFILTVAPDLLQSSSFSPKVTADLRQSSTFSSKATADVHQSSTFSSEMTAGVHQSSTFSSEMTAGVYQSISFSSEMTAGIDQLRSFSAEVTVDRHQSSSFSPEMTADVHQSSSFSSEMTADVHQSSTFSSEMTAGVYQSSSSSPEVVTADVHQSSTFSSEMTAGVYQSSSSSLEVVTADLHQSSSFSPEMTADVHQSSSFSSEVTADVHQTSTFSSEMTAGVYQSSSSSPEVVTADVHQSSTFSSEMTAGVYQSSTFSSEMTAGVYQSSSSSLEVVTADLHQSSSFSPEMTADVHQSSSFSSEVTADVHQTSTFSSEMTAGVYQSSTFSSEMTADVHQSSTFSSEMTAGVYQSSSFSSEMTVGIDQLRSFSAEVTVDRHQSSSFSPEVTAELHQSSAFSSKATVDLHQSSFSSEMTADLHQSSSFSPEVVTADVHQSSSFSSEMTAGVHQLRPFSAEVTAERHQSSSFSPPVTADAYQSSYDSPEVTFDLFPSDFLTVTMPGSLTQATELHSTRMLFKTHDMELSTSTTTAVTPIVAVVTTEQARLAASSDSASSLVSKSKLAPTAATVSSHFHERLVLSPLSCTTDDCQEKVTASVSQVSGSWIISDDSAAVPSESDAISQVLQKHDSYSSINLSGSSLPAANTFSSSSVHLLELSHFSTSEVEITWEAAAMFTALSSAASETPEPFEEIFTSFLPAGILASAFTSHATHSAQGVISGPQPNSVSDELVSMLSTSDFLVSEEFSIPRTTKDVAGHTEITLTLSSEAFAEKESQTAISPSSTFLNLHQSFSTVFASPATCTTSVVSESDLDVLLVSISTEAVRSSFQLSLSSVTHSATNPHETPTTASTIQNLFSHFHPASSLLKVNSEDGSLEYDLQSSGPALSVLSTTASTPVVIPTNLSSWSRLPDVEEYTTTRLPSEWSLTFAGHETQISLSGVSELGSHTFGTTKSSLDHVRGVDSDFPASAQSIAVSSLSRSTLHGVAEESVSQQTSNAMQASLTRPGSLQEITHSYYDGFGINQTPSQSRASKVMSSLWSSEFVLLASRIVYQSELSPSHVTYSDIVRTSEESTGGWFATGSSTVARGPEESQISPLLPDEKVSQTFSPGDTSSGDLFIVVQLSSPNPPAVLTSQTLTPAVWSSAYGTNAHREGVASTRGSMFDSPTQETQTTSSVPSTAGNFSESASFLRITIVVDPSVDVNSPAFLAFIRDALQRLYLQALRSQPGMPDDPLQRQRRQASTQVQASVNVLDVSRDSENGSLVVLDFTIAKDGSVAGGSVPSTKVLEVLNAFNTSEMANIITYPVLGAAVVVANKTVSVDIPKDLGVGVVTEGDIIIATRYPLPSSSFTSPWTSIPPITPWLPDLPSTTSHLMTKPVFPSEAVLSPSLSVTPIPSSSVMFPPSSSSGSEVSEMSWRATDHFSLVSPDVKSPSSRVYTTDSVRDSTLELGPSSVPEITTSAVLSSSQSVSQHTMSITSLTTSTLSVLESVSLKTSTQEQETSPSAKPSLMESSSTGLLTRTQSLTEPLSTMYFTDEVSQPTANYDSSSKASVSQNTSLNNISVLVSTSGMATISSSNAGTISVASSSEFHEMATTKVSDISFGMFSSSFTFPTSVSDPIFLSTTLFTSHYESSTSVSSTVALTPTLISKVTARTTTLGPTSIETSQRSISEGLLLSSSELTGSATPDILTLAVSTATFFTTPVPSTVTPFLTTFSPIPASVRTAILKSSSSPSTSLVTAESTTTLMISSSSSAPSTALTPSPVLPTMTPISSPIPTSPITTAKPPPTTSAPVSQQEAMMVMDLEVKTTEDVTSTDFKAKIKKALTQCYLEALQARKKRSLAVLQRVAMRADVVARVRRQADSVTAVEVVDVVRNSSDPRITQVSFYVIQNGSYVPSSTAATVFSRLSLASTSAILAYPVLSSIRPLQKNVASQQPGAFDTDNTHLFVVAVVLPSLLLLMLLAAVAFIFHRYRQSPTPVVSSADVVPTKYLRGESLDDYNLHVDVERGEIVDRTPRRTPEPPFLRDYAPFKYGKPAGGFHKGGDKGLPTSKQQMIDMWLRNEGPPPVGSFESLDSVAKSDTFLYRKKYYGPAFYEMQKKKMQQLEAPQEFPYSTYLNGLEKTPESSSEDKVETDYEEDRKKKHREDADDKIDDFDDGSMRRYSSPDVPEIKPRRSFVGRLRESFKKRKRNTRTAEYCSNTQSTMLTVLADSSQTLSGSRDTSFSTDDKRKKEDPNHTDASDEFTVIIPLYRPRSDAVTKQLDSDLPGRLDEFNGKGPKEKSDREQHKSQGGQNQDYISDEKMRVDSPLDDNVTTNVSIQDPSSTKERTYTCTMETQTSLTSSDDSRDDDVTPEVTRKSIAVGPDSVNRKTQTENLPERARVFEKRKLPRRSVGVRFKSTPGSVKFTATEEEPQTSMDDSKAEEFPPMRVEPFAKLIRLETQPPEQDSTPPVKFRRNLFDGSTSKYDESFKPARHMRAQPSFPAGGPDDKPRKQFENADDILSRQQLLLRQQQEVLVHVHHQQLEQQAQQLVNNAVCLSNVSQPIAPNPSSSAHQRLSALLNDACVLAPQAGVTLQTPMAGWSPHIPSSKQIYAIPANVVSQEELMQAVRRELKRLQQE